ncbi:MAG: helix-turn-helix domain-containing protein [Arcobacter sp.]|uniref:helix-turn-helix domain-containing protein n=1 Tax=Arcobacter sp. TaxID=1872629 RepID=UPI003C76F2B8
MNLTKNMKSDFDEFLKEEEIFTLSEAIAIKRVLAYELEKSMEEKDISKTDMAKKMHTSRTSLNRVLDPMNTSITLATMENVAAALGKRLQIALV